MYPPRRSIAHPMRIALSVLIGLLSFANGANDNCKGAATLEILVAWVATLPVAALLNAVTRGAQLW